jgi:phosphoadenosine phosphosulfate reductase
VWITKQSAENLPLQVTSIPVQLKSWRDKLEGMKPAEILNWADQAFHQKLKFATSLGLEDQAITDLLVKSGIPVRLFTLDTGRLFSETHNLIERTELHYGIQIMVFSPESTEVESMVGLHGINLFRQSKELRKLCCEVRKIHPLKRALKGAEAWLCGLRRGQSLTREQINVIEWDELNQLFKLNPLWNWSEKEVWDYIKENKVPYNPLHEQGFLSIGCSCCTRAVKTGEDLRAGRWWWEQPEHKECGLHQNA